MIEQPATPRFWIAGPRQALVFAALVVLGFLAWGMGASMSGEAPLLSALFEGRSFVLFEERPFTYAYPFYLGFNLYMLFALLSGFLFPRCFYLWGIALLLTYPFAEMWRFFQLEAATGMNAVVPDGAFGWISVAFGSVVFAVFYGSLATGLSVLGAGLRLVAHRLRAGEW